MSSRPSAEVSDANRQSLLALIQACPGIGFRELMEQANVAPGTVAHHLSRLGKQKLIWRARTRSQLLHFPGAYPGDVEAANAYRDAMKRRWGGPLLDAVLAQPGRPQQDYLGADPALSRSGAQHRLKLLVRVGVLRTQAQGRCLRYWPIEASTSGPVATSRFSTYHPEEVQA